MFLAQAQGVHPRARVSTVFSQMKHADQSNNYEVDRDNEIEQTRDNKD